MSYSMNVKRHVWPDVQRVAFVDVNPEHNSVAMHFAETLAVNRGVIVRMFGSVSEADAWLMGFEKP